MNRTVLKKKTKTNQTTKNLNTPQNNNKKPYKLTNKNSHSNLDFTGCGVAAAILIWHSFIKTLIPLQIEVSQHMAF